MKRFFSVLAGVIFAISLTQAKTPPQSAVAAQISAQPADDGAWLTQATFYTPSVVRITKYPAGVMPQKKSYSVIAQPVEVEASMIQSASSTSLASECMTVEINNLTGAVTFKTPGGDVLLAESGVEQHTPCANAVDAGKYKVRQNFTMPADEVILGLGQRQCPVLNQRMENVRIWSGNTNVTIPYFASEKGYGLYWDNAGDGHFLTSASGVAFEAEVAPMIDYYFFYSDGTLDGVVGGIRAITGEATMLPLAAHGHWQCRERYKSSDELCDVLDRYRRLEVPLDGIVQDWQYWGCDSNWNAMRFMNPRYIDRMGDPKWMRYLPNGERPDATYPAPRIKSPQEMVDYVHANNSRLMISIWASFGPWTDQYRELKKINALLPFDTWPRQRGVLPYDAFNPKARDIYWKYLTHMYKMGFDAWWTDSTEPDHFEQPGDLDYMTHDGSWRSVKNAFPIVTNRGIYEHQRAMKGNNRRSMQMTRCGAFGMQHYGTFGWSGDVVSNWGVMKNQIPSGLNYVICGLPYWNTDIGGFFGWDYGHDHLNPALQELQVRWMQWGTFMPMMRNHCSGPMVNEIYKFGEPGHWAFDAQKRAIELRYHLMPYIYSLAGNATHHAGTIMRPLMMDFASDRNAITLTDQYMFGPALLVKPITDPLYTWLDDNKTGHEIYPDIASAAAPVNVYLPAGSTWYDFWTDTPTEGGKTVTTTAPIDRMPVYVKSGSIVPFGPKVQYTAEKPWDELEIRVYAGADGEFSLYEDDGNTYNYEKGEYTEIPMKWDDAKGTLTFDVRRGVYPGMLETRKFNVVLVSAAREKSQPLAVDYNGTSVSVKL